MSLSNSFCLICLNSYLSHLPHQFFNWSIIEKLSFTFTTEVLIKVLLHTEFSIIIFSHITFRIFLYFESNSLFHPRITFRIGYVREVGQTLCFRINFVIITDNFQTIANCQNFNNLHWLSSVVDKINWLKGINRNFASFTLCVVVSFNKTANIQCRHLTNPVVNGCG